MSIGAKNSKAFVVASLAACLVAGLSLATPVRAAESESKTDFLRLRLDLSRDVEKEVKLALGSVAHEPLRLKASRLFGVKSGDLDIVSRLVADLLVSDILPDPESKRPPLPIDPAQWNEFARDPSYAQLRVAVLTRVDRTLEDNAWAKNTGKTTPKLRKLTCGGGDWIHGLLSETVTYSPQSDTYFVCDRFAPSKGTWDDWKKSLSEIGNRAPASSPEAIEAVAPESYDDGDRSPASAVRRKAVRNAKARAQAQRRSAASERRSRLPSSVADGFELRFQYGKMVSTFWVVKRGDRHDLLFANSQGSKAKLTIPPESFSYLQSAAQGIQTESVDPRRCGNASMQMHVVASGQPERTVTSCFKAKTRSAQGIRTIGNLLSAMVR